MKKIAVFCCCVLMGMIFSGTTAAEAAAIIRYPTAIYVFGDSTADDGNNNRLPGDPPKSNYQPYGVDFPGGRPTGRFSNGFIGVDYIAQAFGYPLSPPPYHVIKYQLTTSLKYMKGVNFASAGAGILDTTGKDVITMNQQMEEFREVTRNITSQLGSRLLVDDFLARALFIFSVGSNDLFAAYAASSSIDNGAQMDQIINQFKDQLMMLYKLGARKFGVTGTGLIGCIPVLRNSSTDDPNDCIEMLNDLSLSFKNATKALLADLKSKLNGFKYSFGDSYELGASINSNPSHFGFTDLKTACCGALTTSSLCDPNSSYCSRPDERYFWDGIHPSQATYKLIAHTFLYGSQDFNIPVNLYSLALS